MLVNKNQFVSLISMLEPGTSTRDVLDQANCFIFEDGKAYTFNDEIACYIESDLVKNISGAVHAQTLKKLMDKIPDEDIDISTTEDMLIIKGSKFRSGLRLEKNIVLPISVVDRNYKWVSFPEGLDEAIKIASSIISTNVDVFKMSCVHITPNKVESTNGVQIVIVNQNTNIKDALVKATYIKSIIQLGFSKLSEGDSWLHFANDVGLVVSIRKYVETYPNLDGYVPKTTSSKIKLPHKIRDTLERAAVFTADNYSSGCLKVEVKQNKLKVIGEGSVGWYAEVRGIEYDGPDFSFLMPKEILDSIVSANNELFLNENRTVVKTTSGKSTFVAALQLDTDQKEDSSGEKDVSVESSDLEQDITEEENDSQEESESFTDEQNEIAEEIGDFPL